MGARCIGTAWWFQPQESNVQTPEYCRRNHHPVPKLWVPITEWGGAITKKNGDLNCTPLHKLKMSHVSVLLLPPPRQPPIILLPLITVIPSGKQQPIQITYHYANCITMYEAAENYSSQPPVPASLTGPNINADILFSNKLNLRFWFWHSHKTSEIR